MKLNIDKPFNYSGPRVKFGDNSKLQDLVDNFNEKGVIACTYEETLERLK